MSDCNAVQCSDQMTCSCGNVWDMNDPYPPECKTEPAMLAAAPAAQGEPVAWYLPNEEGYDSMFRDHATVKACTDNPWAGWQPLYTTPQPAEQQPAPDVARLVEVLTELCNEIDKHEIHAAISKTNISWFKRKARAVLAAHRTKDNGYE